VEIICHGIMVRGLSALSKFVALKIISTIGFDDHILQGIHT